MKDDTPTTIGDIVLVHLEDNPMLFARIEDILADHKPGWHHVKLLFLQLPLQVVTWILRDVYIQGEAYTMGGQRMRLEKVVCPEDVPHEELEEEKEAPAANKETQTGKGRVISLADMKKK